MSTAALRLYSAPEGVEASSDYKVTVNGQELFVHQARVSAEEENQVWPGHQRPIEQSNLSAFAYCDASGLLSVEVECLSVKPEQVILHPQSAGIKHELQGQTIRFELIAPAYVVLEINGWRTTFQLFVNPPESEAVNEAQDNMIYYGPGIHDAGEIRPEDGQTIYIHGEAIVYGTVYAKDKKNVTLRGRGILDSSRAERTSSGFEPNDPLRPAVGFFHCSDLIIEGIILRDSPCYNLFFMDCAHAEVAHLKIIGQWRYNTDGIDIYSSRNVSVRDCFIRSFDDSIALKAGRRLFGHDSVTYPVEHIRIERCIIWNDWGKALEIGVECETDYFRDIEFRDIDILHFSFCAISIANGNEAKISDVLFDDIRVYTSESGVCFMQGVIAETFWAPGDQRGSIHDVTLRRISLDRPRPSNLFGFSQSFAVRNIVFDQFAIGGQQVADAEAAGIKIGEHADVPRFL